MTTKKDRPEIASIKKAIKIIGGQAELAEKLGFKSQGTISQWVTDRRPLPAIHCRKIELLTESKVTRYDLRPDIFGPAPTEELKAA